MRINYELLDDFWVEGDCGDYTFQAKVFDEPSKYGINKGCVSQLLIKDYDGEWVVNYDRGWDVRPDREVKSVYKKILNFLESLD